MKFPFVWRALKNHARDWILVIFWVGFIIAFISHNIPLMIALGFLILDMRIDKIEEDLKDIEVYTIEEEDESA